jgi:hypothetical protein
MGGLLAADALLKIVGARSDKQAPMWPNIAACIAFDTPVRFFYLLYYPFPPTSRVTPQYLGLHPSVFKNTATKAVEYASTTHMAATGVIASLSAYGAKKSAEPVASENPTTLSSTNTPKSSWRKWAPAAYAVGGALLAGAVGTAYYKRENLGQGYAWATDHMKYVGNLWDEDTLKRRVEQLIGVEETLGVTFRV